MNTHTLFGEKRRLALITLFASLCSVFAVQIAVRSTSDSSDLSAAAGTYDVSVRAGDRGTTAGMAEYRDAGKDIKGYQGSRVGKVLHNAACKVTNCKRTPQTRSRK